jgi:hypothetical protein
MKKINKVILKKILHIDLRMTSTGMSYTLFLRGDTTVTTISGDSVTIFELENQSNIILGILSRNFGESTILKKTPIGINVSSPINKSFFTGLKPIDAFEITSNDFNISFGLPISEEIKLNRPDGTLLSLGLVLYR